MRVLVTGASGQLGYDVCLELERRGIEYRGVSSKELDITNAGAVRSYLGEYRPDAVIHCAAYTQVDRAEDETEKVFRVNRDGTCYLAEACKTLDAKMIYISTDYVFPGNGTEPYDVSAPTGPTNVYGVSKLAGEEAVKGLLTKYFIVRISWVFGINGNNFINTMLRLSETRDEISVVDDQVGSPTYTADLALLLCDMITTEKYGTYHATNEGFCSWAEFAKEIFRVAGKQTRVNAIPTSAYPTKATRPANSRLSKDSLANAGFERFPEWKDALQRYIDSLRQRREDDR